MTDLYWDNRARRRIKSKGERLYTITPIPLYLNRRKWIYERIAPLIKGKSLIDFGCGDGHFCRFAANYTKKVTGIEISQQMLANAQELNKDSSIVYHYYDGSPEMLASILRKSDCIDIIVNQLTLAHIDDRSVEEYIKTFSKETSAKEWIVFEQVTYGKEYTFSSGKMRNKNELPQLFIKYGWEMANYSFYETTLFNIIYSIWRPIWKLLGGKRNTNFDLFVSRILLPLRYIPIPARFPPLLFGRPGSKKKGCGLFYFRRDL